MTADAALAGAYGANHMTVHRILDQIYVCVES